MTQVSMEPQLDFGVFANTVIVSELFTSIRSNCWPVLVYYLLSVVAGYPVVIFLIVNFSQCNSGFYILVCFIAGVLVCSWTVY